MSYVHGQATMRGTPEQLAATAARLRREIQEIMTLRAELQADAEKATQEAENARLSVAVSHQRRLLETLKTSTLEAAEKVRLQALEDYPEPDEYGAIRLSEAAEEVAQFSRNNRGWTRHQKDAA